ncbi:MAG TPA: ATP-binding cassette domain-containing protein [Pyrinomonadaceae bacterium]|jgi:ABC-type polar amino acid transport system ATPase subunit
MISATEVRKTINGNEILHGISFEVAAQTVLGIIGGSGSGKTTLLRCLNGLERIDGGTIECDGVRLEAALGDAAYRRRVKELRRKVGMVFQHLHLFPHLTALGNIIEAPVNVARRNRREAETHAHELLTAVGLARAAARYPESMSGGEQQRVAIARALAMRPNVLLFDEPTSALDPRRVAEMRTLLRQFTAAGHTLVVVSHSIGFLTGLADNLLYMEAGAAIEYGATAQLLNAPQDARTREFLQQAH